MFIRKVATCACLFAGITFAANAICAEDSDLSLREAVERVLARHPQFRIYQLRSDALQGEQEDAALQPPIEINAGVENFAGTGDLNWLQGAEWSLSLSRIIEHSDKSAARVQVVRRRQSLLDAEQQIRELDLLSDTATSYIELTAALRRLEVQQRASELAANSLLEIERQVATGRLPEAELLRARAEAARATLAISLALHEVQADRVQLTSHWGEFGESDLQPSAELFQFDVLPDVNLLLERLKQSPAVSLFTSQARLQEAELQLARSQQRIDYSVGAGIKHYVELNDTAFAAELSIPLQTKSRARGAMTTAQANLLRVDAEQEAALWQMQGRLLALDQQRRAALARFDELQSTILPLLQQAYESTSAAYESGLYDFHEVSSAQSAMLDAELASIDAAEQSHILRIEIERLSGQPFYRDDAPNGGIR